MSVTLTNVLPLHREHVRDSIVDMWNNFDKDLSPILAGMELKSVKDGAGRKFIQPFEFTQGSAVGPDFTTAQAIVQSATDPGSASGRGRWEIDAVNVHTFGRWTRDAVMAAQGDSSKMLDLLDRETINMLGRLKKRLAHAVIEAGYGRIGTISAVTTSTVTIGTSQVNRVSIGDEVMAAALETSGAARSGSFRITGWDPDTGIITLSGDPSAVSWAASDTLLFNGYRNTTTPIMPIGLRGWVPTTAPGATTFWNVNRQNNPDLGGLRVNCASLSHAEGFIRMANRARKYGTKLDAIYCSPEDFEILSADKDATKVTQIGVGKYDVAFSGVSVNTLAGDCPVVPDVFIEQGTCWGGPWKDKRYAPYLFHNDDLMNIDDLDGNTFRAVTNAAEYEMRGFFRGNIVVPAPGRFIVGYNLPTA
jgi:hypothetical protein